MTILLDLQITADARFFALDWASVVLCDNLFKNTQSELLAVYSPSDAMKIYFIALLRVCNPGIKNYELKEAYETSFLSELYPDAALSKNTVSAFLNNLGKTLSRIVQFMRNRTSAVALDHHLLIDGTLKSDESEVNSLSDFSRKAKTKGTRDISVLYVFDLEEMEPVCSKCFPGNMLDATSYKAFIAENGITKGIIVGDKGFPETAYKAYDKAKLLEDYTYKKLLAVLVRAKKARINGGDPNSNRSNRETQTRSSTREQKQTESNTTQSPPPVKRVVRSGAISPCY